MTVFKILSTPEQMNSTKREEFYRDKLTIAEFNKRFDNANPESTNLSFYEKYCSLSERVEVWGAIKVIPMSDKEPWIDHSYSISTFGRIKSHKQDKELKCKIYPDGYQYIFLSYNYVNIQRAVLSTFGWDIPTDVSKSTLTVNHKDRNRSFNELQNLEWMSNLDNIRDANRNSPSIKITVVKECVGIPIGTMFFLKKRSDVSDYGINATRFKERIRNTKYPYGLLIEKVDDVEDNVIGLSDDIVTYLKSKIN